MGKKTERKHRRKLKLFKRQNGKCHYCDCDMILTRIAYLEEPPHNIATIEHLHDKFSPERGNNPGKESTVLACWKCNNRRGVARNKQLGPRLATKSCQ